MQNHLLNNPVFEFFFLRQLKHVNPCIFCSVVIQNKTEHEERNKLLFSQYPLRMCTNGKWKNRISANCLTPGSHRMQKVRDIYVQYVCVRACLHVCAFSRPWANSPGHSGSFSPSEEEVGEVGSYDVSPMFYFLHRHQRPPPHCGRSQPGKQHFNGSQMSSVAWLLLARMLSFRVIIWWYFWGRFAFDWQSWSINIHQSMF